MSLLVLDTDKDFKKVQQVKKYKRGEFRKAGYNKAKEKYFIEKSFLKGQREEFIIVEKNYYDDDFLAVINQEDELEDFLDFFIEFKKRVKNQKL